MTLQVKATIRALRPEIDKALAEIAKKRGLKSLRAGNASFTNDGFFSLKVEGILEGGLSKEESFYDDIRETYALPARGAKFTTGFGPTFREYTIVGTNTTGSKIIVKRTGIEGLRLLPIDVVKRATSAKAAA